MRYTRSLGGLRLNKKRKDHERAPEYTGRLLLTRDTLEDIYEESRDNENDLIEVSLAAWKNERTHKSGKKDRFLTVEVRALSQRDERWYKAAAEEDPILELETFFR